MQKDKRKLIDDFVASLSDIYGSHLKCVILYGSYARRDNRADSDIDIMILVDISELEAKAYQESLSELKYNFYYDHDTEINPIVHSEDTFNKWVNVYPFFKNIVNEGVILYGAA